MGSMVTIGIVRTIDHRLCHEHGEGTQGIVPKINLSLNSNVH
jgi:hypothetical protein